MVGHSQAPNTLRFGAFEADLRTEELRKHGVRLRLQQQPFRILAVLAGNPGRLIGRDELIASLWPDGRNVDFDHGLNAAVTRLRQILADSAENPKYIETIAGKGYRFIAPVEVLRPEVAAAGAPPAAAAAVDPVSDVPGKRRWLWLAAATGLLLAAGGGVGWIQLSRAAQNVGFLPNTLVRLTSDTGLTTMPALSPDGTLLTYASDRAGEGTLDIWVQQVGGGEAIRLTRGGWHNYEPSFSPDGKKIVFRSERDGGGVYVIPTLGGNALRLAEGGGRPRFSPDGKWIAYTEGATGGTGTSHYFMAPGIARVHVMPASGGESRVLCPDFAASSFPVWAPDSTHVLFLGNRDANLWGEPDKHTLPDNFGLDWFVASLEGGAAIATGTSQEFSRTGFVALSQIPQAWLPNGDGVLVSGRVGDTRNLWVVPISRQSWKVSGRPHRVSSGTTLETFSTVAANGRVAFVSLNEAWDVWSLPMNTNRAKPAGALQRLTRDAAVHTYPTVSPDGTLVAFASNRNGHSDIWLKNLASGQETAITNTPTAESYPSFSPDGSKLIYRVHEPGRLAYHIQSLVDGSTKRICEGCTEVAGWSPDAKRILCLRCSATRIGILNLATDERTQVADHPTYTLWNPRFSPDAKWISFNATAAARSMIFVARLRSGERIPESAWIPITEEQWADYPRWSPDGNSIYFLSERDGFRCIWAQSLDALTKRPTGQATAAFHSHQARLSLGNISIGDLEMSVARDKLVFNMGERTANIWMATLGR